MIPGKIGKDTSGKFKPGNTALVDRMRADLHKRITATGIDHFPQQAMKSQWVGRSVIGRYGPIIDIIADSR